MGARPPNALANPRTPNRIMPRAAVPARGWAVGPSSTPPSPGRPPPCGRHSIRARPLGAALDVLAAQRGGLGPLGRPDPTGAARGRPRRRAPTDAGHDTQQNQRRHRTAALTPGTTRARRRAAAPGPRCRARELRQHDTSPSAAWRRGRPGTRYSGEVPLPVTGRPDPVPVRRVSATGRYRGARHRHVSLPGGAGDRCGTPGATGSGGNRSGRRRSPMRQASTGRGPTAPQTRPSAPSARHSDGREDGRAWCPAPRGTSTPPPASQRRPRRLPCSTPGGCSAAVPRPTQAAASGRPAAHRRTADDRLTVATERDPSRVGVTAIGQPVRSPTGPVPTAANVLAPGTGAGRTPGHQVASGTGHRYRVVRAGTGPGAGTGDRARDRYRCGAGAVAGRRHRTRHRYRMVRPSPGLGSHRCLYTRPVSLRSISQPPTGRPDSGSMSAAHGLPGRSPSRPPRARTRPNWPHAGG